MIQQISLAIFSIAIPHRATTALWRTVPTLGFYPPKAPRLELAEEVEFERSGQRFG